LPRAVYECVKRKRCSVCQRRLVLKISLHDDVLRCSHCKFQYVKKGDHLSSVSRAVRAKKIKELRYLFKFKLSEFKNELKKIEKELNVRRFMSPKHIRNRLLELKTGPDNFRREFLKRFNENRKAC